MLLPQIGDTGLYLHSKCSLGSGHQRGRSGGDILPCSRQRLDAFVVAGKTVDAALHKNKAELRVLVLAIAVKMLADGHGLLDEAVHILRKLGCQATGLEDAEDFAACDGVDHRHTETVAQGDTDLRRSQALLRELADVVSHILRLHLQPSGWLAAVWGGRGTDALSGSIHAAHFCLMLSGEGAAGNTEL